MTELTLDSDLNRSQLESLLLVHSLARSLLLIIDGLGYFEKLLLDFLIPFYLILTFFSPSFSLFPSL
jgi:hypothetical protein